MTQEKLKCLYVEDDKDSRESMAKLLEISEIQTKTCKNPEEAKTILEREKFDFVISDLTFPNFSFEDVKEFVKSNVEKGTPVVICSAAEWKDGKPKGIILLQKPITYGEFERALKEVTEKVAQKAPEEKFELSKPDRHVKTPLMKAVDTISQDSTKEERNRLGSSVELLELNRNLNQVASGRMTMTKKDLDDMMKRYMGLARRINPSRTRRKTIKRTVQMQ